MPALKIKRRELFAQNVAKGMSLTAAQLAAGYGGWSGNAAAMAKFPDVAARIKELKEQRVRDEAMRIAHMGEAEVHEFLNPELNLRWYLKELHKTLRDTEDGLDTESRHKILTTMGLAMGFLRPNPPGRPRTNGKSEQVLSKAVRESQKEHKETREDADAGDAGEVPEADQYLDALADLAGDALKARAPRSRRVAPAPPSADDDAGAPGAAAEPDADADPEGGGVPGETA